MLQKALVDFAVPKKQINLLKLTFTNTFSTICIHGKLSWPFEIVNGVWQRDAISCLLFAVTLQKILRDTGIQGNNIQQISADSELCR